MFSSKRILPYIIVILLCLPLLFINIKSSHDWGDDFAQYILQAKNIAEGQPHWQTKYIHNEDAPFVGPRAFPPGFPLLLAPVYALEGVSIAAFTRLISVFLILFCAASFAFFRHHFSLLASVLLLLLLSWNPWLLMFKTEVMSDIPFAFFFMLCTVLYIKRDRVSYVQPVIIGLLAAFMISVRNIGIAFVLAVIADMLLSAWSYRKKKDITGKKDLIGLSILIASIIAGWALTNVLLFPSPAGASGYQKIIDTGNFLTVLLNNLSYNIEVFLNFFTPTPDPRVLPVVTRSCAATLLLLGLIVQLRKGLSFIELVFFAYIGVILVYPYSNAGLRFLLPVIPFAMYYIACGLQVLMPLIMIDRRIVAVALGGFMLLQYAWVSKGVIAVQDVPVAGPYDAAAQEAFAYVHDHTPAAAVIVFIKPRALALYADRKSLTNPEGQELTSMEQRFKEKKVNYYLVSDELSDPSLKELVKDSAKAERVWENEGFELYRSIY